MKYLLMIYANEDTFTGFAPEDIERLIADTEASLRQAWPQIASVYIKPKAQPQAAGTIT